MIDADVTVQIKFMTCVPILCLVCEVELEREYVNVAKVPTMSPKFFNALSTFSQKKNLVRSHLFRERPENSQIKSKIILDSPVNSTDLERSVQTISFNNTKSSFIISNTPKLPLADYSIPRMDSILKSTKYLSTPKDKSSTKI